MRPQPGLPWWDSTSGTS